MTGPELCSYNKCSFEGVKIESGFFSSCQFHNCDLSDLVGEVHNSIIYACKLPTKEGTMLQNVIIRL